MTLTEQSALAYRWRDRELRPVAHPHAVALDNLLCVDRQKALLVRNTRQFVAGAPSNHALLTGARGTGKSSLVKALLTAFADDGLRLVEVAPHDLAELPDVVRPLRERDQRFVLYVDDFSVGRDDPALSSLKAALDGDIEAPPDNVLIIATSNRRHLMPEARRDNEEYAWADGELHPGESTEEKISLSERFGLWLSFPAFDQSQYLQMVEYHLQQLGVDEPADSWRDDALRWALNRASRSGRVAAQFARDHAGRAAISQPDSRPSPLLQFDSDDR